MLGIRQVQLKIKKKNMHKIVLFVLSYLPGMVFSVDLCSFLNVGKSRNDVCVIALNGVTIVKFVGSTLYVKQSLQ
jgi:hypothetical protein